MDERVSAAEANRNFSAILRAVREGHRYVVTSHGRPVAKIVPIDGDRSRGAALDRLLTRLESQPTVDAGAWTRDELYED